MHAIARGNLEFARELVARHSNVNAQNLNGDTALLSSRNVYVCCCTYGLFRPDMTTRLAIEKTETAVQ
jgi:hypothetical protein